MNVALKEFNQIVCQINGVYHDICTKMGISDSDFDILYMICEQGDGCNQSTIYKSLWQKKSTINSSLKKLEKQGFLSIEPGEGRQTRIFLTEKGKELSANTAERVIAIENEVFNNWSKEDQEAMVRLNQRYLEGLVNGTKVLFEED